MTIAQGLPHTPRAIIRAILVAGALAAASTAAAQTGQASEPFSWTTLAMGAIGGLALFLYGVDILATALKQTQGGRFQKLLQRSSSNRVVALASGTAATVVLDSSSVVIILLITIVDAGLIPFAHSLPFILGANIGTTFSSQVSAWNIDTYAPAIVAAPSYGRRSANPRKRSNVPPSSWDWGLCCSA